MSQLDPIQFGWISGTRTPDAGAIDWGALGVESSSNSPPIRRGACLTRDPNPSNPHLYLFAGWDQNGWATSDTWRYNYVTNLWTWVHEPAPNVENSGGVAGADGQFDSSFYPSARYGMPCAASNDPAVSRFYLFSGDVVNFDADLWAFDMPSLQWARLGLNGYSNTKPQFQQGAVMVHVFHGATNHLYMYGSGIHELWSYDILANTWSLEFSAPDGPSVFPPIVPAFPGNRNWPAMTSAGSDVYVFGGFGTTSSHGEGVNELWKYNTISKNWTFCTGNTTDIFGGHSQKLRVSDPNSYPSGRIYSSLSFLPSSDAMTQNEGGSSIKLLLVGGFSIPTSAVYNDVWIYDSATNEWTWMAGDANTQFSTTLVITEEQGFGPLGYMGVNNTLPPRSSFWLSLVDRVDSGSLAGGPILFLFGGNGYGYSENAWFQQYLQDLWAIRVPVVQPIEIGWISGTRTPDLQAAHWGALGVESPSNSPPIRVGGCLVRDPNPANPHLYLFGGLASDINQASPAPMSDVWRYNYVTDLWTWVHGPSVVNQAGVAGLDYEFNSTFYPSARYDFACAGSNNPNNSRFYLYSGDVISGDIDLWVFDMPSLQWARIKKYTLGFAPYCPGWTQGSKMIHVFTTNIDKLFFHGSYGNELWSYDITTNNWDQELAWTAGPSVFPPTVPNYPGGRVEFAMTWAGSDIYMFGGYANPLINYLGINDLWKYSIPSKTWTFCRGGTSDIHGGQNGTLRVPDVTSYPSGRAYSQLMFLPYDGSLRQRDGGASVKLLLVGGSTNPSTLEEFDDVWLYDSATNGWTWMSGDENTPHFGSQIVSSAQGFGPKGNMGTNNTITPRDNFGMVLVERVPDGNLRGGPLIFLFGGAGYPYSETPAGAQYLQDLWAFRSSVSCVASDLPQPKTGAYDCSGTISNGRSCALTCPNGYFKSGTDPMCLKGLFTAGTSNCTAATCAPYAGFGVVSNCSALTTGATCSLQCSSQYRRVDGGTGTTDTGVCTGSGSTSFWHVNIACEHLPLQPMEFGWISGTSTPDLQAAQWGTLGVESPTNSPPIRIGGCLVRDPNPANPHLYLFGGLASDINQAGPAPMSDVWRYNYVTDLWTWVHGPNVVNQAGVAGQDYEFNSTFYPSARYDFACAGSNDPNNSRFYLYSGDVINGDIDLWVFDMPSLQWARIKKYTLGFAPYCPGWTQGSKMIHVFTTSIDKLFFHGSYGNELWSYDIIANNWDQELAWTAGPSVFPPTVPNYPGGRVEFAMTWAGSDIYMFGGLANPLINFLGINDLWKYNIPSKTWTFCRGGTSDIHGGQNGSLRVPDPTSYPTGRAYSQLIFLPSDGAINQRDGGAGVKLLLVGGFTNPTPPEQFNDVWMYDSATNIWTWMAGDENTAFTGSQIITTAQGFGLKGNLGTNNTITPRNNYGMVLVERVFGGNLKGGPLIFLFGGGGYPYSETPAGAQYLQDLWAIRSNVSAVSCVASDLPQQHTGTYGCSGTVSDGQLCALTCPDGYIKSGSDASCLLGVFSPSTSSCSAAICAPYNVTGVISNCSSQATGGKCTLQCATGYRRTDSALGSDTGVCTGAGSTSSWHVNIVCQQIFASCDTAAFVQSRPFTTVGNCGSNLTSGSVCSLGCAAGYQASNASSTAVRCVASSPLSSVVVIDTDFSCEPIIIPDNGSSPLPLGGVVGAAAGGAAVVLIIVVVCCRRNKGRRDDLEFALHNMDYENNEFNGTRLSARTQFDSPSGPVTLEHIPYSDLLITEELGAGFSSVVTKAEWHGTEVAYKMLRNQSDMGVHELEREIQMSVVIGQHPRVVMCLGVSAALPHLGLVMNLMSCGSVQQFMATGQCRLDVPYHTAAEQKVLKDNLTMFLQIAVDCASGVLHLHEKHVVHRDIAARNFLVDSLHRGQVADFGSAVVLSGNSSWKAPEDEPFPIKWCSPESLLEKQFSLASDVYTFGIFLWEMVTCSEPFPGQDPKTVAPLIHQDTDPLHPSIPGFCPREIASVMQNCWLYDPARRPPMKDVVAKLQAFHSTVVGGGAGDIFHPVATYLPSVATSIHIPRAVSFNKHEYVNYVYFRSS